MDEEDGGSSLGCLRKLVAVFVRVCAQILTRRDEKHCRLTSARQLETHASGVELHPANNGKRAISTHRTLAITRYAMTAIFLNFRRVRCSRVSSGTMDDVQKNRGINEFPTKDSRC